MQISPVFAIPVSEESVNPWNKKWVIESTVSMETGMDDINDGADRAASRPCIYRAIVHS